MVKIPWSLCVCGPAQETVVKDEVTMSAYAQELGHVQNPPSVNLPSTTSWAVALSSGKSITALLLLLLPHSVFVKLQ